METTVGDSEQPQRDFFLSEPKAILQTINPTDEDSNSEDLPSTVDIEALKEPLLPVSDDPLHMGQWRNNAAPRPKIKAYEAPKKDQQVPNGLENESQSEKSRETDGSSSESDSDSDSGSCSGSSSSGSSCNSSASSDSSDSDSDSQSNTSCHSIPTGGKKSTTTTTSRLSLPIITMQAKDPHSRSNSSTSSRSRKSKQFSISQSTYEPGSLKLKIAALKLPPMSHQQVASTPDQKQPVVNNESGNSVLKNLKSTVSWRKTDMNKASTTASSCNPVVNGDEKRTNTKSTPNTVTHKYKELEKTPCSEPRRSSRYSRGKSCGESPSIGDSPPVLNGMVSSSLKCHSLPPKSKSGNEKNEQSSRSSSLVELSSPQPSTQESGKQNIKPSVVQKLGLTSSLNENVTMTANNGFNITPKRNTRTPSHGSSQSHVMNSLYQIRTGNNVNGATIQSGESILDPVLRLTKNSDLTIFAINPPKSSGSTTQQNHTWNNNQDLVMITPTGTTTPTNNSNSTALNIQSSPLRSSRRLSAQRRSIDKSDFESWDSADANAAVQAAIQRIDSEVISSSKLNTNSIGSCNNISTLNKKYNSSLLEKFTELLTSTQGSLSPKIGDVSIEPITSSPASGYNNKSKSSTIGSHNLLGISKHFPSRELSPKQKRDRNIKKSDQIDKVRTTVPEALVKICRLSDTTKRKQSLSEKVSTDSNSMNSDAKKDKRETEKASVNPPSATHDASHFPKASSKASVEKPKSPKHKKSKPKLNKLSIFAPPGSSRQAKLLRSNGKLMPQTMTKAGASGRDASHIVSLSTKIKSEKIPEKTKNVQQNETNLRFKSDKKLIQTKSTREIRANLSNKVGSNKNDMAQPINPTSTHNGPMKPFASGNIGVGQQQPPQQPMVKTKGAKKYIPENENFLVIPQPQQVLPAPADTTGSASSGVENETTLSIQKKKSKKSRAKEKKDKNKNKAKKQKVYTPDLQVVEELCSGISNVILKGSSAQSCSAKANKKQANIMKEKFTFEKILFKNLFTPLIPNNEIPPPPYEKLLTKPQKKGQHSPRTTANRVNSNPLVTSLKKRKQGNETNSIGDSSDTTLSDSSSANTSSSELQRQRLPLKKRHHHTGVSSGQLRSTQDSKGFNFDEDENHATKNLSATSSRYRFGGRSIDNTKLIVPVTSVSEYFGKLGLINQNSTDKDKNISGQGNLDFKSLANSSELTPESKIKQGQSVSSRRKVSSSGTSVRKDEGTPKQSKSAVSPAETEKRRSNRIRKPRVIDGETIESPTKSTKMLPVSPNKGIKPEIRELAKKIEATITPVVNEIQSTTQSTHNRSIRSNFKLISDSPSPISAVRQSKKRLRSEVSTERMMEDNSQKRIKLDTSSAAGLKPMPELVIIDDDDDVVEIQVENPDKQSGVEIILTQTSVPLPLISPTSSSGVVKKRRKVNKTGFPVMKKKKKNLSYTKLPTDTPVTPTPSTSGVESVDADSDDIQIVAEVKASRRKNASTKKNVVTAEHQFSSTLTERVKIRKRNSVDGNGPYEDGNDTVDIPGVSPALINVPDAPIIIPVKTNSLPAGLLSNYYKQNSSSSIVKKNGRKPKLLAQVTGPLLPPPAYCPQFVRQRIVDYTLPFDVWCLGVIRAKDMYEQWQEEQRVKAAADALVAKEKLKMSRRSSITNTNGSSGSTKIAKIPMPEIIPPSWNFKKIRTNVYFGTKPVVSSEFDQSCSCPPGDQKCSADDCLNRVVYSECPPTCGETCTNRRIQKHDWAPFIKRTLTPSKGYGVFTHGKIKKGEFILEYVGEVVPDALFKERMHTIYANDTHHYCLQLDGGLVIDGHRAGGEGRFVNHSCEPNCEMQKWVVAGLSRMALFALRDIEEGEELSYDYNFSLFNPAEGQPCHCGSSKCRGVIGGRTKNLKNEARGTSKRKTKGDKGVHIKENAAGNVSEPNYLDKMKVLSRKERLFIQKHRVFLVRNYYTIRHMRGEVEDKVGHKLEKIMLSWSSRYKAGSNKIKPLLIPDDDPELGRMARIAQILYMLYSKLTTARDESSILLCSSFMTMPTPKKCPKFFELFDKGQEAIDFSHIGKRILQGEYKTLTALENDIAIVLSTFCLAYEKEKPNLSLSVDKIKALYMQLKGKAMSDLEPFIVVNGRVSELPDFVPWEQKPEDDVIRCICETFSEEGMMIQCEKCMVWQHADCVRVPQAQSNAVDSKRRKKGKGKVSESRNFSVTPITSPFNSPKSSACTPKTPITPLQLRGEGEVELEDMVINVNDELPMMCEDSSSADVAESKTETKDIKTPGGVTELPAVTINDMETQKIDDDDFESTTIKRELETIEVEIKMKEDKHNPRVFEQPESLDAQAEANTSTSNEPYFCEKCNPRGIDAEVPLDDNSEPDKKHFLCLVREDGLMLHKNDTVYVLRDSPPEKKAAAEMEGKGLPRLTYQTAGQLVPSECDIFRIEALWKDSKGARFVFGYHYLRPNETFHEPSRRFYPNEILRAPLFEVISIDLIHGRCWVVDPATYCKGRPMGCQEDHLYICEYRVDKQARCFSKVKKNSQSVCTKPFAFQYFESRLKIQRNVHPHGPPSPDFRVKPLSTPATSANEKSKTKKASEKFGNRSVPHTQDQAKTRNSLKRLNRVLVKLHAAVPDSSYCADVQKNEALLLYQWGRKKPTKKFSLN